MDFSNLELPVVDTKTLLDDEQKAQAEAMIRAQGRVCRGPCHPAFAEARNALLAEGGEENKQKASELDARGRLNPATGGPLCSVDRNDTIVAGPWDGKEHKFTCSSCGVKGVYIAPTFAPKA